MRNFSKTAVNKAGAVLKAASQFSVAEKIEAENILTYWRYIHSPVINTFQAMLRIKISNKYQKRGFIAQRLKRAPSIIAKLKHKSTMKLATMQDIAGIRAVMKDMIDVKALYSDLKASRMKHSLYSEDDYILTPKSSGYRGIHLIYEYVNPLQEDSSGLKIEVQIRTELMHVWATAVETMGTFAGTSLKSSVGDQPLLDFFSITSSAFAILEDSSVLSEHAHLSKKEIFGAVVKQFHELSIMNKMTAYTIVVHEHKPVKARPYHLVTLDLQNMSISVKDYKRSELEQANIDYTERERAISAGANQQVVLVSIDTIDALKKAYPNYYLDTADFIEKMGYIEGHFLTMP